jgi:hypothetical protein
MAILIFLGDGIGIGAREWLNIAKENWERCILVIH